MVNRALPTIATGVDPSEEEERHLQQALLASVFGNSQKSPDIPVPVVTTVQPPSYKSTFKLPDHYIVFDRTDAEFLLETVEYDADFNDNSFAKDNDISVGDVEIAMDVLEKAQAHEEALISPSTATAPLAHSLPNISESQRKELYNHWHHRRSQHNRPFLRIFQPPPDPNNTDPSVAFRPRDREAGSTIAHRMNTLDNFRRASTLRDELVMLRQLLSDVVNREKLKVSHLSLRLLHQRIKVAESAGPNLDTIIRYVFPADLEPVITVNSQPSQSTTTNAHSESNAAPQAIIPCRWLNLPSDIKVVKVRLAVDKPVKKTRKRNKAVDKRASRDSLGAGVVAERTRTSFQHAVDTFGFDEYGNRFLKLMRCFSGGFNNYGVSPYDHRVFSAASERNTVREVLQQPRAVNFPSSAIKFGRPVGTTRFRSGGKVGPNFLTAKQIKQDILSNRPTKPSLQADTPKPRRVVRVRGRVGRGGRIILDRVVYEREHGTKAASYPGSVEMGGVYTAGIPLEVADTAAPNAPLGTMGKVALLAPPRGGDNSKTLSPMTALAQALIPPLKSMNEVAQGIGAEVDAINYWPRRSRDSHQQYTRTKENQGKVVATADVGMVDINEAELVSNEAIRGLPSYAPRSDIFLQIDSE